MAETIETLQAKVTKLEKTGDSEPVTVVGEKRARARARARE